MTQHNPASKAKATTREAYRGSRRNLNIRLTAIFGTLRKPTSRLVLRQAKQGTAQFLTIRATKKVFNEKCH